VVRILSGVDGANALQFAVREAITSAEMNFIFDIVVVCISTEIELARFFCELSGRYDIELQ